MTNFTIQDALNNTERVFKQTQSSTVLQEQLIAFDRAVSATRQQQPQTAAVMTILSRVLQLLQLEKSPQSAEAAKTELMSLTSRHAADLLLSQKLLVHWGMYFCYGLHNNIAAALEQIYLMITEDPSGTEFVCSALPACIFLQCFSKSYSTLMAEAKQALQEEQKRQQDEAKDEQRTERRKKIGAHVGANVAATLLFHRPVVSIASGLLAQHLEKRHIEQQHQQQLEEDRQAAAMGHVTEHVQQLRANADALALKANIIRQLESQLRTEALIRRQELSQMTPRVSVA